MTEARQASRAAGSRQLSNPLAVIVTAAASFLVVLVLLTARVMSGHDPAMRASAPSSVLVSHGGHTVALRTTASGKVLGGAAQGAQGAGFEQGAAQPATIVTHTSGGLTSGGGRDE